MFPAYRRLSRNTIVLAASIGGVMLMFFAWQPLLPLYLRTLGADDVSIGAAFSIFIFAHTIPAVAGGMLADRFGRKWVALGPGLILAPLYILAGLTRDWRVLTGIIICCNVFGAVQWPAMQAMISESDEATRATAFSLIEIFVLAGSVIGPLLGSLLLPFIGVSGLIIVSGVVLLFGTWVRARELHETHQAHTRQLDKHTRWRDSITHKTIWIILSYALFSTALGLSIAGPFTAILARDVWSLDDQAIQQLTALGAVTAFGGVWLGGKSDRWGSRQMWILITIGFAVSLLGWGLSRSAIPGAIFVMAANLFYEALFIVSETMLAEHTTRASRSFLFGLFGTAGGFAESAGPIMGTSLANMARLSAPFVAGAVVSLLSLIAILPVRNAATEKTPTAQLAD